MDRAPASGTADVLRSCWPWTITSGMPVMSAHVVVDDSVTRMGRPTPSFDRLRDCLADHFDVEHSTFQIEPAGHSDSEPHVHH